MAEIASLIHEISTSTGTGDMTLLAVNARRTFNVGFGTGGTDLFYYSILNRDEDEWEYGTGHLSSSTVLVRDTVIKSSNSDNAVNFSAGTKDVINDLPAEEQITLDQVIAAGREKLTADRTYYVRTDGDDGNTGLANNSGEAFLTVSHALDYVSTNLDFSGYTVTISINNGTYTLTEYNIWGLTGGGTLKIEGQTDETLVTLTTSTGYAVFIQNDIMSARLVFKDLTFTNTKNTAGNSLVAIYNNGYYDFSNVKFGDIANAGHAALDLWGAGVHVTITGVEVAIGSGSFFASVYQGATLWAGGSANVVSGSPTFSAFYEATVSGTIFDSTTWTGSITGLKAQAYTHGFVSLTGTHPGTGVFAEHGGVVYVGGVSSTGINTLDLGHASDTTLSRLSAGVMGVEGNALLTAATLDADLISWAAITRASGFDTFVATPSGANLASLLTTALPVSKGGTGQTTEAEAIGEMIQALTEDTTPDRIADFVGTYDTSADTGKKVLPYNLTGLVLLATNTVAAQTNTDFILTGYPAFKSLRLVITNYVHSTGAGSYLRVSTNGGSSFISGASDYGWFYEYGNVNASDVEDWGQSGDYIASEIYLPCWPTTTDGGMMVITFENPSSTFNGFRHLQGQSAFYDTSPYLYSINFTGVWWATGTAYDAFRIVSFTGNHGFSYSLYGEL